MHDCQGKVGQLRKAKGQLKVKLISASLSSFVFITQAIRSAAQHVQEHMTELGQR
jgi:hypothetical protein